MSKIIIGFELNKAANALSVAVDDYEQPVRVTAKGSTKPWPGSMAIACRYR